MLGGDFRHLGRHRGNPLGIALLRGAEHHQAVAQGGLALLRLQLVAFAHRGGAVGDMVAELIGMDHQDAHREALNLLNVMDFP